MRQSTNRGGLAKPQVWFRIVHLAQDGRHQATGDDNRGQTVEIGLGPKRAFKTGNTGALTRRVGPDRLVTAPARRVRPKPLREPRAPHVVGLLRTAIEWRHLLDTGEVETQAAIARREGITRTRVTQTMSLLRLAPEIQQEILALPETTGRPAVTERALRSITQLSDPIEQRARFDGLAALVK